VLEERMTSMNAKNESAIDRMNTMLADFRTESANREKETAQREKENQRWIVGFGIAQIVLTIAVLGTGFAFLGILIGLPD